VLSGRQVININKWWWAIILASGAPSSCAMARMRSITMSGVGKRVHLEEVNGLTVRRLKNNQELVRLSIGHNAIAPTVREQWNF
jgi:hypothetical protein